MTIVGYWVTDDVGRVINPIIVKGQLHGGIVQGIGQALLENILYDGESGQNLTGSLMDYAMPRAIDVPQFSITSNEVLSRTNPLGSQGSRRSRCGRGVAGDDERNLQCPATGRDPALRYAGNAIPDLARNKRRGRCSKALRFRPGAKSIGREAQGGVKHDHSSARRCRSCPVLARPVRWLMRSPTSTRTRRLQFIIRAAPGGNYDLYLRLLARHMVRYMPGNPTAVPVNMPGGGGPDGAELLRPGRAARRNGNHHGHANRADGSGAALRPQSQDRYAQAQLAREYERRKHVPGAHALRQDSLARGRKAQGYDTRFHRHRRRRGVPDLDHQPCDRNALQERPRLPEQPGNEFGDATGRGRRAAS